MNDFIHFVLNHWLLSLLFVLAFVWLVWEEARHQGAGGVRLSPEKVVMLMNHEEAVPVDLRDANAFKDGHITQSIHIPAAQIEQSLNKINRYKQSPLVLVCAMGQQSVKVMHQLKKQGFEKIFILTGGMAAWKKANLPLKK